MQEGLVNPQIVPCKKTDMFAIQNCIRNRIATSMLDIGMSKELERV
jgi:hypothetical protein